VNRVKQKHNRRTCLVLSSPIFWICIFFLPIAAKEKNSNMKRFTFTHGTILVLIVETLKIDPTWGVLHATLVMQALPRVFFDVSVGPRHCGRLVFQLFRSAAPKNVENFIGLCTGKREFGYKNSRVFKIVSDEGVYGGDVDHNDGTGGRSIFGGSVPVEHRRTGVSIRRGVLSMLNVPVLGITSQWVVHTSCSASVGDRYQVIGELLEGYGVLDVLSACISSPSSTEPLTDIVVSQCGIYTPIAEPDINWDDYE
jgi:cyclophilin family peptidyl-prolyl cis-trans isomerase